MTEPNGPTGRTWEALRTALRAALVMLLLALPVRAPAEHLDEAFAARGDDFHRVLRQAEFCETRTAFDDTGCAWRSVALPHRWTPRPGGASWGLYRFDVPHPGEGDYGLVTERMSLSGRLKVDGRVTRPSAVAQDEVLRLAFWPQMLPFHAGPPGPDGRLRIEIAVAGHASSKSGLGGAAIAEQHAARHVHFLEMRREVFWPLVMAVTVTSLGLVGLMVGERATLAGRIGLLASATAVAGGLATMSGYWTAPILPPRAWTTVEIGLLALTQGLTWLLLATFLYPKARWPAAVTATVVAAIVAATAVLDGPALFLPGELVFPVIGLALLVTETLLAVRAVRTRDALALSLLVPTVLLTAAGLHDLAIHLSEASVSDHYITRWALPGLLLLLLVTTLRVGATRRATDRALQRQTEQRESLLRDLHDGVGSRLVALSFDARHRGLPAAFVEQVDALVRELRTIEGTVRAGPTTLDTLLADLRHTYATVGGGLLPLRWEIGDAPPPVPLTPEQAVAFARIVEEAIANAIKHARPGAVTITLEPPTDRCGAVLTIADDGPGRFDERSQGGLANMRHRAQRAGLELRFVRRPTGKAVQIAVPGTKRAASLLERLRAPRPDAGPKPIDLA